MPVMTVAGLRDLRSKLTDKQRIRSDLHAYLDGIGKQITAEIKARCPSVTGALRASIRHEVRESIQGLQLIIHVGDEVAYYAAFVEYGTAHAAAHPFIRPVINAHRASIPADIASVTQHNGNLERTT